MFDLYNREQNDHEKIDTIGILKWPWIRVKKYVFPWKDKQ